MEPTLKDKRTLVSAGIYAAAALSFFLPFVMVSCNGIPTLKLSGVNLATGVSLPTLMGPPQHVSPDFYATVALALAVLGFLLSFAGKRLARANMAPGILGVISLIGAYFIFSMSIAKSVARGSMAIISFHVESGLWIAALLLAAAAVWNYSIVRLRPLKAGDPLFAGPAPDQATANVANGAPPASSGTA